MSAEERLQLFCREFDSEDVSITSMNDELELQDEIWNDFVKENETDPAKCIQNTEDFFVYNDEEDKFKEKLENIEGVQWELNGDLPKPMGLCRKERSIFREDSFKDRFVDPLSSFLSFLPYSYWEWHLQQCNLFAEDYFNPNPKEEWFLNGLKFKPITIEELFAFYAILLQQIIKPSPGKGYASYWGAKDFFTACKHLSVNRFKQIRFCLHWNDNRYSSHLKDTCYKVRPILNYMNATLGRFIEPASSLAFDETTCPIRSQFAKVLIFLIHQSQRVNII